MKLVALHAAVVAAASLCLPSLAEAQTALGEITGEVRDPSGGAIAGVGLRLTNLDTGFKNTLVTNHIGLYYIRSLAPGVYEIDAEAPGFKSYRATGIRLLTAQVLRYDITLELGQTIERIDVTAEGGAVEIQKDSGDVSTVLNEQTIRQMPAITRKSNEMVALTAGVNMNNRGSADSFSVTFFSIAGNPGVRSNMFVIDGTNSTAPRTQGDGGNMPLLNLPPEVLQEMRVITNNYSAEFGQGMGGVVIMTTKSGTNDVRGQLYYYGQNDALGARNFFASRKTPNHFNNYGGTIGGPIVRNKTHYFVSIDGERTIHSSTQVLTLPTLEQRSGDFSRTFDASGNRIPIYDPATTRTDLQTGRPVRDPFPGNLIPAARFDPIAAKILNNYVADPNSPGSITGANNFRTKQNDLDLTRLWQLYRVDHQLTDNDRLYGRVTHEHWRPDILGPFRGTKGDVADPFDVRVINGTSTVGAGWTRVITPRIFSDFRFDWGNKTADRRAGGDNPPVWDQNWAGKLGFQNLGPDAFPAFALAGYTNIGGWGANVTQERAYNTNRAVGFHESLSYQRGRHGLRIGGEWKHSRGVYESRYYPSGRADFTLLGTAQPGVAATGNSVASFLLGQVDSAQVRDAPPPDYRTWYLGAFLQDDWRVNRTLTLNLGVRYEFDRPKVDVTEGTNFFNLNKINPVCNCPGVVEFGVNKYAISRKHTPFYNSQPHNFAPRFGFAWTPFGRQDLVVRGGYGIFYTGIDYGDTFWDGPQLGRGINQTWSSDAQGLTPPFRLFQGFPQVPVQALNDSWGAVPIGQLPRINPTFLVPVRPAGYAEQFNFGVQKKIGQNLLEVGYLGNAVKHVPYQINYNQVTPEQLGPGFAQARRPFPQFGNVVGLGAAVGSSLYHALLVQVKRQFSGGLSFTTHYTFARQLDDISYRRSDYDRKADYGRSNLELRHRFVWGSVYELPWGPGKKFLGSGPWANLLGGWNLGAIVTLQSGQPLSISSVTNTCNCFNTGTQGVNLVGDVRADRSNFDPARNTWFNTKAFAFPTQFTFGNLGAGVLTAPGLVNVDSTITRSFRLREKFALELRGEFFNFFNHTNFSSPNTTFGSAAFGRVTSSLPGRVIQVAAKLLF